MPKAKSKKDIKLRDMKPSKDAKGGHGSGGGAGKVTVSCRKAGGEQ